MPFAITFAASHELEPRLAREIDVAMCVAASSRIHVLASQKSIMTKASGSLLKKAHVRHWAVYQKQKRRNFIKQQKGFKNDYVGNK